MKTSVRLCLLVISATMGFTSYSAEIKSEPFKPYFYDNFENVVPGTHLAAPYDAAGRSVISAEQAHAGKQSVRMEIHPEDKGGFGNWGAVLPIRPALTKGQEVWMRLYVYWPAEFQFTASPWMKFLRFHTRSGDSGKNTGYNDLYIERSNEKGSVLRSIKEVHDKWAVYEGSPIPHGRWERYEMYLYLDDVPVKDGGKGRVRIWRDGERIFDRTDVPTLVGAKDLMDGFFLFTYWNNEKPPENHCYIDDLTLATSANPPPQRDTDGNPVIGDWTPAQSK